MSYKDLSPEQKKMQKALNKLISEEFLAATMYRNMIFACIPEERHFIKDLFEETAEDEHNDHFVKLIDLALELGLDVPTKLSDYEKYAGESTVKQQRNFKKDQCAAYYVDEAIKAEVDAIKSYQEILQNCDCQVSQPIILHNYYDECEHLEKFQTLKIAMNASVQLKYI